MWHQTNENVHHHHQQLIKRRARTQITKKQKEILEYAYAMKSYPDANEIEYMCHLLGFEENVIRVRNLKLFFMEASIKYKLFYFQNRFGFRIKDHDKRDEITNKCFNCKALPFSFKFLITSLFEYKLFF